MMEVVQLIEILRRCLGDKRYVVVLDNVSNVSTWDGLKFAFPDNCLGSRIIVTTRIGQVGYSCTESSGGHMYNLYPLSEAESWMLFCNKAFQSSSRGTCPQDLEELSWDIVRICDGQPLAIAAIGGLLSKKENNFYEWNRLTNKLKSEIDKNPDLERIRIILLLSYNDLSYSLKSCFLYFSMFPKNYSVKRIMLIRLWIAEGFIASTETGKTVEEVADGYLNELIDRSMIQVAEFYDYGRVRSCRVHDIIWEIIALKSEEENFSTSLSGQNKQMKGTIRRLSFQNTSEYTLLDINTSRLRALFMFGSNTRIISSSMHTFSGLKLLRVLDLEGVLIDICPVEFGNLHHLRYLSLRNTRIHKLSKSLGKLISLETLDLKGTYVSELPTIILKLQNLRHLLAYHYYTGRHPPFYNTLGAKVPRGIGSLRELQKLSYIEANQDSAVIEELGYLTQLKRLGIVKLRSKDGAKLCSSVEKMTVLLSFSAASVDLDEPLNLQYLSSPPPFLKRLYLRGPLETLPNWIASLNNLVRLHLRWSKLREDSLGALQALPNLMELALIRAYNGVKLCCKMGGFQKLKILDLDQLDNLHHVTVERAMPNLQKMYIRSCVKLEMVPTGIEQLKYLRELHLFDMPEVFLQSLRRHGGQDRLKVEHIPIIRCYDHQNRICDDL